LYTFGLICMVNTDKYTIHASYGQVNPHPYTPWDWNIDLITYPVDLFVILVENQMPNRWIPWVVVTKPKPKPIQFPNRTTFFWPHGISNNKYPVHSKSIFNILSTLSETNIAS